MISTWIEAKVLLWLINPTWPIPLQPLPFHKPYHFTKFLISFPLLPLAPSLFCSNHSGVQVVPQAFHAHSSSWLLSLSVPRWGILSLGYSHWFLPLFFFFPGPGLWSLLWVLHRKKPPCSTITTPPNSIFLILFYFPPHYKRLWDSLHIYMPWLSSPHFCSH